MCILGFDASTTTVGWAINCNNKIKRAGFIRIDKHTTLKDKTFHVIDVLKSEPLIKKITHINLEESLSGYARGFTSQQTIIKLARFNAVFEYILSEHYKMNVNLLSVNTLRKYVLGKVRQHGITSKEFVKNELLLKHPYVESFNVLNTRGNVDVKNYDMYDACVVALYDKITTDTNKK